MNTNSFLKNTSWIMLGRIFQIGITFIMTMLVPRYLGPEKYGVITYAYSFVVIFSSFATLGLNDIAVKELLDKNNNKEEVVGTMVLMKLVASVFSIVFINSIVLITNDSKIIRIAALLQSLSLLFQSLDTLTYFYQSQYLSHKTAIINVMAYTITAAFRVYGLLHGKSVEWFAFAVSFDYLVISIFLLFVYLKDGHKLAFNLNIGKKFLSKSYNYIFASLMIGIYGKIDVIILENNINETVVGYYSAATTLVNAWPFVLQALIDSFSPIIINKHQENKLGEYERHLKQMYATIFYVSLIVGVVILLFSDLIVGIIFGEAYLPASIPLKIVGFSSAFSYFGVARATWTQCENKISYEKIIYSLGAISSVILNLILIPKFGIVGAAISLTATQFLTNFVYVLLIPATRKNGKLILDGIMLKGVF